MGESKPEMSVHRYAAKRDSNEPEIIAELVGYGASVQKLSAPGVPDLLVGYRGGNYLVEVKAPKTGRLTEEQRTWHEDWLGAPPIILTTADEAAVWIATL